MEMPLSPEIEPASQEIAAPDRFSGLASSVATEHSQESGNGQGSESPAGAAKRLGRPPIHGRYSKAAGSDGKNPVPPAGQEPIAEAQVEPQPESRVIVPADLLQEVWKGGFDLAESFAQFKMRGIARLAGLTDEEIQPQLDQAQLGDKRKQLAADLMPYVLKEWGIDIEVSPTWALVMTLGTWGFSVGSAYWTLATLAQKKLSLEGESKPEKHSDD